jgi:hypothetical protein
MNRYLNLAAPFRSCASKIAGAAGQGRKGGKEISVINSEPYVRYRTEIIPAPL